MSLPDSVFLIEPRCPTDLPPVCHRVRVLSDMRNRSGAPNLLMRGLALLLALLLAGPLTVLVVRAAAAALGRAL